VRLCVERSDNQVDTVLLRQGLHNEPERLNRQVQSALERTVDARSQRYDATLLGYGLCCNGIVGLTSKVPIVAPRGHDCITMLLGSKERYQRYFESGECIYWYSDGWIRTGSLPGPDYHKRMLAEYKGKYGQENAEYLMETEKQWLSKYTTACYIDWGLEETQSQKRYTKRCAEFMGWKYREAAGDSGLLQRLVDGEWDEEDFLIVEPGQKIAEDVCGGIIRAK